MTFGKRREIKTVFPLVASHLATFAPVMVVQRAEGPVRVTICPSRAVTIGSGLVDMIGTSRLGDITAGISDPCR